MTACIGLDPSPLVGDYKNTDLSNDIVNQLLRIPHLRDWDHEHEILTFRTLTFALSSEAEYYNLFLEKDVERIYPRTYDNVNEHSKKDKLFYLQQKESKSHGHTGHICAASVPNGHFVYNCYDCGVDPTCCLCENCFNKEEHSDHNVSVHRSSGDAICDCGDESSWKVPLDCKANKVEAIIKKSLPALPEPFKQNIRIIVRTLLDYLLDANLTNFHSLPALFPEDRQQDFLNKVAKLENLPKHLDNTSAYNYYYTRDEDDEFYERVIMLGDFLDYNYLVIWNDEFHNFDEAQYFLRLGQTDPAEDIPFQETPYRGKPLYDMTRDKVGTSARIIDKEGFICYARSKDPTVLKLKMEKLGGYTMGNKEPLHFTMLTGQEYSNLLVSRAIVRWFDFILKNGNLLMTDFIKEELTSALFEKATFYAPYLNIPALVPSNVNILTDEYNSLYEKKLRAKRGSEIKIDELTVQLPSDILDSKPFKGGSRLQYLFYFESRFPKSMRKTIKKTILPIISNKTNSRFEFAKQIMTLLPTYEYHTTYWDREWRLSFLETFRLQVYHDPNLGTQLMEMGLFENTLDSILGIFASKRLKLTEDKRYFIDQSAKWKDGRTTEVLTLAISGFGTLLKFIHPGTVSLFKMSLIIKLLQIFTPFDEVYTLKRKEDVHEEYENDNISSLYHSTIIPLLDISRSLADIMSHIESRELNVEHAIILVASYLKSKKRKTVSYNESTKRVVFDVTQDGVSMMHPIGELLAQLITKYKHYAPEMLLESVTYLKYAGNGCNRIFEIDDESQLTDFLGPADEMLQPLVFEAQIGCNFWIRNGIDAVLAQRYFDAYDCVPQHLYIIQQGIILDQLPLVDIVDRFMLLECFEGVKDFAETVYDDKITMMLSDFIFLMYHVLTFRQLYDSAKVKDDINDIFREYQVCALLAKGPRKYSAIKSKIRHDSIEDILKKVAHFEPPTTYNDYGMYSLQPEYAESLDPFTFFNSQIPTSELEEALVKIIADSKKKKIGDVTLNPYIYPLNDIDSAKFKKVGSFMKSAGFVKFLYKILRFAVTSDHDSHLNVTLQLIHAIIIDDEMYNTSEHDLRHFVEIPVCNLLLIAAEKSDLPKYIARKASTILEKLLLKDDDVLTSLLDCFGSSHIEEYKKSSYGKGLETKLERKRRLALKRQKKVLKKMMKQQSEFVTKNSDYLDGEDGENAATSLDHDDWKMDKGMPQSNDKPVRDANVDERCCIMCKNPPNTHSLFGTPIFLSASSAFWTIPSVDIEPPSFMVKEFSTPYKNDEDLDDRTVASCVREKVVVSGCPHGMHYECFKQMLAEKRKKPENFTCPLCKYKFNGFTPSFKQREYEVDPNAFDQTSYTEENLNESIDGENVAALASQIFDRDMFKVLSDPEHYSFRNLIRDLKDLENKNILLQRVLPPFREEITTFTKNLKNGYYSQFSMALAIGSTLELQEITTRDTNEVKIPEILHSTLQSLLQYRILKNYMPIEKDAERKEYYRVLIHNPDLGFTETIMLLFTEGKCSLAECIKFSLMKRLLYIGLSLVERSHANPANLSIDSIMDEIVPEIHSDDHVYKMLIELFKGVGWVLPGALAKLLYKVLVTNHKIYRRQVDYICKFLNVLPAEDGKPLFPEVDDFVASLNNSDEKKLFKILFDRTENASREKEYPPAHKRDAYIYSIEYAPCVHFIDLPMKLKDLALTGLKKKETRLSLSNSGQSRTRHVKCEHICLHCGVWMSNMITHVSKCLMSGYSTLVFTPIKNTITMLFSPLLGCAPCKIESPYLNKHGEPAHGLIGFGDAGTLNNERYKHLQKEWFKQTLVCDQLRTADFFSGVVDISENQFPGIFELSATSRGERMFQRGPAVMMDLFNADPNNPVGPDPQLLLDMFRANMGRMGTGLGMGFGELGFEDDDDDESDRDDQDDEMEVDDDEADRIDGARNWIIQNAEDGWSDADQWGEGREEDAAQGNVRGWMGNPGDFNFGTMPDSGEEYDDGDSENDGGIVVLDVHAPAATATHTPETMQQTLPSTDEDDGDYQDALDEVHESDDESSAQSSSQEHSPLEHFIGRDVYGNYVQGTYPVDGVMYEDDDEEYAQMDSPQLRDAYYMNFLRDTAGENPTTFQDSDPDDDDYVNDIDLA